MHGSPQRLTIREQFLAAVQDNPGVVAEQLPGITGKDSSFARRASEELRASALVKSVTNKENSRRCWYYAC